MLSAARSRCVARVATVAYILPFHNNQAPWSETTVFVKAPCASRAGLRTSATERRVAKGSALRECVCVPGAGGRAPQVAQELLQLRAGVGPKSWKQPTLNGKRLARKDVDQLAEELPLRGSLHVTVDAPQMRLTEDMMSTGILFALAYTSGPLHKCSVRDKLSMFSCQGMRSRV